MRTKALFVAAAIGLATVIPSLAQVYSVNVVGYVNVDVPTGFSLVSNPLDATSNNVQDLMPAVNMTVYKFTDGSYEIATYIAAASLWTGPNFEINPGEGVWINNAGDPFTITFVGEITEGTKDNAIPAGFSIRSSIIPQSGTMTALGWPAEVGDAVYEWDNAASAYATANFVGVWVPAEPTIEVGQAFFASSPQAKTWSRDFVIE